MSKEDLEIEIPEFDLKFMKDHGFHLKNEDSKTAEIASKTVYFKLEESYEKIEIMIVFQSSVIGSYVMFRYGTQSVEKENTSYEFIKSFSLGSLSNAFADIENQVLSRLFFNEKTATSYRIASMMKTAAEMNDESKMIGKREINTYYI